MASLRTRAPRRGVAASWVAQVGAVLVCGSLLQLCGTRRFGVQSFAAASLRHGRSRSSSLLHQGAAPRCLALQATAGSSDGSAQAPDFLERKEAVKRCLAREYRSFFRPFEGEFYADAVTFKDPLNELAGKDKYRSNVEMLSGESPVGNLLFDNGYIDLHAVEDVPGDERRLRTRWTLGFNFKLLPWRPQALFTGVSEYVIDGDARVVSQRDFWDTLSLGEAGGYSPEATLSGLADLGAQLLPSGMQPEEPPAAKAGIWSLLRRASTYRVYRDSAGSGPPFAIVAPGSEALTPTQLGRALSNTGLVAGEALYIDLESGSVTRVVDAPGGLPTGAVSGLEVKPPHPWDGPPPPE